MRALGALVAVAVFAWAGCEGEPTPPEAPQIKLDRSSLGFNQEFGSGTYLGTTTPNTLLVINEGRQDLIISSVTESGDTTSSFTIDSYTDTPIKYNDTPGAIRVNFRPRDAGIVTATMTINSNAENAPSIDVPLSGRGINPDGGQ